MKKLLTMLTAACLLLTTVTGCATTDTTATTTTTTTTTTADSYHVVATNFAVYDWTKTILGDDDSVTVTYLLDSGIDSHSYQPSADDIIEIATCDLFIYVGGESDTWVDGVLAQATNDDLLVLNLMEALGDGARAEETVEGMEVSEHDHDHEDETEENHDHEDESEENHDHDHEDETEEDHDHDHEDEDDHDHADEEESHSDEHIWLSLVNAQVLSSAIAEQLMAMHSANADQYATNLDAYVTALSDLDGQYEAAVAAATGNTILVADRFPFLYLVSDYGIDYYAAFNGCSAETEASFETIVFLAGKVDELGLRTILTIENVQHEIAQTVSATSATVVDDILVLDSMQSVTADDVAAGANYYAIMEENLAVLIQALG